MTSADNSGKDLIGYVDGVTGLLNLVPLGPIIREEARELVKRFTSQQKNSDGPVWYNMLEVRQDQRGELDGRKTVIGMTRNAVYDVDWKVRLD
jgi:hypothetical protein